MSAGALPVRERVTLLGCLALITAISWTYLWRMARDPAALCMVNMNPWSTADLAALFAMWTVMMMGMMLPSASPMILAFAGVNRARRARSMRNAATAVFVLGYAAIWTAFSLVATLAQETLHSASLLSSMGASTSRILGAVLLIATGVFQWTPFKNSCLRHCRSPLGFILTEWRDGSWGAFQMGLRHGAHCAGCCCLLMALLFIAGVMNLWWVAAITAFVLIEKVAPGGLRIARASGLVLVAAGGWMLVHRFS